MNQQNTLLIHIEETKLNLHHILGAICAAIALAACGGGGSDAAPAAQTTTPNATVPPTTVVTPPVVVAPVAPITFTLVGTLDSISIASASALVPGQTASVSMKSGQEIHLVSNISMNWSSSLNGAVLVATSNTANVWRNVLSSPPGSTVTLVASAVADSSKAVTLTIAVAAQEFTRPAAKVGDFVVVGGTETLVNGTVQNMLSTATVATVASDNSYIRVSDNRNGATATTITRRRTPDHKEASIQTGTNAACTYFPAYSLYTYPLSVGKTYSSTTAYNCGGTAAGAYNETRTVVGKVLAYEAVTTPAGVFNALKIDLVETITNVSSGIPGGTYKNTRTCWVDAGSVREIKCDYTYTYPILLGLPATYISSGDYTLKAIN
jgi:hypothetical protein